MVLAHVHNGCCRLTKHKGKLSCLAIAQTL
nr:MAG TPA: hypothetical protein [Caudoviricetes sp.]